MRKFGRRRVAPAGDQRLGPAGSDDAGAGRRRFGGLIGDRAAGRSVRGGARQLPPSPVCGMTPVVPATALRTVVAVRAGFGASDRRGRAPGGWAEGVAGRYRLAVPDDEQLHGMTPNDRDETGGRLDTVAAGGRRGPDQANSDDEVVDELPPSCSPP